jgi:triosephosphate isomerase (TIM)
MRTLVVGNWKMHGLGAEAAALAREVRAGAEGSPADLVVCPPFTQIAAVAAILADSAVGLGGQDCHPEPAGAHTGDISAPMLRDAGACFVILGHSERRAAHGETDALVRAKAAAAARAGLTPIVCVGEDEVEREARRAEGTVAGQLAGSLPEDFSGIVAYEPIWAIGSGHTPGAGEIAAMHAGIRAQLVASFGPAGKSVPILYGGSVNPDNAAAILAVPEVGGGLVGGASLIAAEFLAIAAAAPAEQRGGA